MTHDVPDLRQAATQATTAPQGCQASQRAYQGSREGACPDRPALTQRGQTMPLVFIVLIVVVAAVIIGAGLWATLNSAFGHW